MRKNALTIRIIPVGNIYIFEIFLYDNNETSVS